MTSWVSELIWVDSLSHFEQRDLFFQGHRLRLDDLLDPVLETSGGHWFLFDLIGCQVASRYHLYHQLDQVRILARNVKVWDLSHGLHELGWVVHMLCALGPWNFLLLRSIEQSHDQAANSQHISWRTAKSFDFLNVSLFGHLYPYIWGLIDFLLDGCDELLFVSKISLHLNLELLNFFLSQDLWRSLTFLAFSRTPTSFLWWLCWRLFDGHLWNIHVPFHGVLLRATKLACRHLDVHLIELRPWANIWWSLVNCWLRGFDSGWTLFSTNLLPFC